VSRWGGGVRDVRIFSLGMAAAAYGGGGVPLPELPHNVHGKTPAARRIKTSTLCGWADGTLAGMVRLANGELANRHSSGRRHLFF